MIEESNENNNLRTKMSLPEYLSQLAKTKEFIESLQRCRCDECMNTLRDLRLKLDVAEQ